MNEYLCKNCSHYKDGRTPPCNLPGAYSVTFPSCIDGSGFIPTVSAYDSLREANARLLDDRAKLALAISAGIESTEKLCEVAELHRKAFHELRELREMTEREIREAREEIERIETERNNINNWAESREEQLAVARKEVARMRRSIKEANEVFQQYREKGGAEYFIREMHTRIAKIGE